MNTPNRLGGAAVILASALNAGCFTEFPPFRDGDSGRRPDAADTGVAPDQGVNVPPGCEVLSVEVENICRQNNALVVIGGENCCPPGYERAGACEEVENCNCCVPQEGERPPLPDSSVPTERDAVAPGEEDAGPEGDAQAPIADAMTEVDAGPEADAAVPAVDAANPVADAANIPDLGNGLCGQPIGVGEFIVSCPPDGGADAAGMPVDAALPPDAAPEADAAPEVDAAPVADAAPVEPEICTDGVANNDGDRLIDGRDPDCLNQIVASGTITLVNGGRLVIQEGERTTFDGRIGAGAGEARALNTLGAQVTSTAWILSEGNGQFVLTEGQAEVWNVGAEPQGQPAGAGRIIRAGEVFDFNGQNWVTIRTFSL